MTWQLAQTADVSKIDSFLSRHIQTSMFPLANLRDYGLCGPRPRAVNFWVLGNEPRAVFGITNEGMVLPQCPDCSDQELADAIALIRGRKLFGLAAEAVQARRIMRLAGWEGRPATLNSDEPGFSLDLEQLVLPDTKGAELVPLGEVDRAITEGWRESYLIEAMDFTPDRARKQAGEDCLAYTARDSHRVLLIDGRPVAMTGFNARLPEIVQIGGVYTPPNLRGRGYARLAVALHLLEARNAGVTRSVLFAASDSAARAYIGIGFQPAGQYSLILFTNPEDTA
ncbi:putative acetyltransferase [Ruegeria denitrificans]|uniref:Putative acetyltransferase n=1 Tax=Ruegeria denitrificans TaxID=1715692 RepID=A0A0P1I9T8_9RHOB|nr:GNAT family N-acetyltransferase [Ruegeria denitrificans]CUK00094.1 putative acetyltransferase [Ruegeria denitrificans]